MSMCLWNRCFFCINLRLGSAIAASILLIVKLYETFTSMIIMIDLYGKAAKDKKHDYGPDKPPAIAVAAFHSITMMAVCTFLEGLRKKEPLRVLGFIVVTIICYLIYIPTFIYVVVRNNPTYVHHDWSLVVFRICVIVYYVYVLLLARSYHHQLKSNSSSTDRNRIQQYA